MACLCCARAYAVLLCGFIGELGVAAMSTTEVGAVLGSAGGDYQRCLLVAAADNQHDTIKRIWHSQHQVHIHNNVISKGYLNSRSHAWETRRRRGHPVCEKNSGFGKQKKKSRKTWNTLTGSISTTACLSIPKLRNLCFQVLCMQWCRLQSTDRKDCNDQEFIGSIGILPVASHLYTRQLRL